MKIIVVRGKTQLADFLYLYEPLAWLKNNPDTNLRPKIFYFSLEMNKKAKMMQALCHYVFKDSQRIFIPDELTSSFEKRIVTDADLEFLKRYGSPLEFLEEHVTFIDNIRNPFGIFNYLCEYANANGTYHHKEIDWRNRETNQIEKRKVIDYYTPNDPNEIVIVIVDHLSLLQPEKNMKDLHEAMQKFSSDYVLQMRNIWNWCVVVVQQQSAESEKQQFTNSGQSIVAKLKPSTDGLGDNKMTQRDVDIMFGLFSPNRFGFNHYNDYDVRRLGDHYRELSIILNRRGQGNIVDNLFFHGAVNVFFELPAPDSSNMNSIYSYVDQLKKPNR